jgi:hypothetical protein
MFTARTVVVIVALGAGGLAASSARRIDNDLSASAGMIATLAVARPASAVQHIPTNKSAAAATASIAFASRITAQKVTEDSE